MGIFSRNTSVSVEHAGRQTWRVRSADDEYDYTISGGKHSRNTAKSQRRLIHKEVKGKTPRWARGN